MPILAVPLLVHCPNGAAIGQIARYGGVLVSSCLQHSQSAAPVPATLSHVRPCSSCSILACSRSAVPRDSASPSPDEHRSLVGTGDQWQEQYQKQLLLGLQRKATLTHSVPPKRPTVSSWRFCAIHAIWLSLCKSASPAECHCMAVLQAPLIDSFIS